MSQSIEDFIRGKDESDSTQVVADTGQVVTPKDEYTPSVEEFVTLGVSPVAKQEKQLEQELVTILAGLPDNGRILQDPRTKKLYYRSANYATSNQDEIKSIIDNLRQGESVSPTQEAVSRGRQFFFEEKAPQQVADYYGLPQWAGTPIKETGLLGQQFLKGLPAVGSWFDEMLTADQRQRQQYEKLRQDYAKEYPERAIPAQIGGLATGIVGGGQVFGAGVDKFNKLKKVVDNAQKWYQSLPPLGQKAVQVGGTTLGAGTEGLIYGAGEGETTDERTISALQTGGMNAMITAPIATAFPILGSLINRFKPEAQKIQHIATEFGISIESARQLKNAFENGVSFADMIKQVERSGNEQMMVDATVAFERLLDASKASSPSATAMVDKAITGRVERQSEELGRETDVILGKQPEGLQTIYNQVAKGTAGARSDAYAKAYDHVIDYGSKAGIDITRVLNRVDPEDMAKAIKEANKELRDKGLPQFQVMAKFDRNGNLTVKKDLNMIQLDYIKRGLDSLGREVNDVGQFTPSAIRAQGQARDLRNAIGESNPAYKEALKISQGKIKTEQAIELGSDLLKLKTKLDDVKKFIKNASKEELSGAKQGVREQIEDIMSNAKTASGVGTASEVKEAMKIVTEMSSRANRNKLKLILGDKTAEAYFKRLDQVKKSLEVQAGVRIGSATAPRQQIFEDIREGIKGGSIASFFAGDPKRAITKFRDRLTGTGDEYYDEKISDVLDDVAKVLTSSDIEGKTVQQALEYLNKVSRGETLTKPQAGMVSSTFKKALESYGFQFGTGVELQRQGLEQ